MKILIIGGNGMIGKKVTSYFSIENEVIVADRTQSEVNVDIADSGSIKKMFEEIGKMDAIVCIAGEAKWADFDDISEEDYYIGLKSKLMGQVNLVRIGREYLNPNGSITLSTGILAEDPVVGTASAAMVNGALNSFVKAAVLEITGIRINVVSLGLVEDSYERYTAAMPGHNAVPMNKVVNGYSKSVNGRGNGEIIKIY